MCFLHTKLSSKYSKQIVSVEYDTFEEMETFSLNTAALNSESEVGSLSNQRQSLSNDNTASNGPLYVSHFLSTWNVRGFEFGAVLFLATIFPGTLLPMSVYAFIRAASAIVFSPMVGRYIDRENRLQVVRTSIGKSSKFCNFVTTAEGSELCFK